MQDMTPRLFIAHEALEQWVSNGRAEVNGENLHDRSNNRRFTLREGVRFLEEVSGAPDVNGLVGKVKDLTQISAMQGEQMADSVILGDNAYRVQQGFVGSIVVEQVAVRPSLTPVAPRKPVEVPTAQSQTIAALQNFFLNNVK
jgi:hypothetical protein